MRGSFACPNLKFRCAYRIAEEQEGRRRRKDYPLDEILEASLRIKKLPQAQQEDEWKKFEASHPGDTERAYLRRVGDRSIGLRLMNQEGRDRLRLWVNPDGSPEMQFLDESGKVTVQFPSAIGWK
jgi:hypothetical protein